MVVIMTIVWDVNKVHGKKCGFNIIAAGTCIYHRPETAKIIKKIYVFVKLRSTEQE
jgi:hypothetical protein